MVKKMPQGCVWWWSSIGRPSFTARVELSWEDTVLLKVTQYRKEVVPSGQKSEAKNVEKLAEFDLI